LREGITCHNSSTPNMLKVVVKFSLCLINEAPRHEDVWGSGGIRPPFLTTALDKDEWVVSRPCRFISEETVPFTHFIRGWAVAQSRPGHWRRILTPAGIEPWPSSPLLYRLAWRKHFLRPYSLLPVSAVLVYHFLVRVGFPRYHSCLRYYATSRKVVGSILNEGIEFFSIDLILPAALWP
jgi:hypothetical protein